MGWGAGARARHLDLGAVTPACQLPVALGSPGTPTGPRLQAPRPRSLPQRAADFAQPTTARGSSCCTHTSEGTAKSARTSGGHSQAGPSHTRPWGRGHSNRWPFPATQGTVCLLHSETRPAQPCDHGHGGFTGSGGPSPLQRADSAGFLGRTPSPPAAGLSTTELVRHRGKPPHSMSLWSCWSTTVPKEKGSPGVPALAPMSLGAPDTA